jgi:hypothetical protein
VTADIPKALAAGVNVSLAPDWTESGMLNLLDEIKLANKINNELWEGLIKPIQLVEFVTRNAAYALGIQDVVGQVNPGYRADIVVIEERHSNPYQTLIECYPCNIKLAIVNGRPMYGNPELMNQFSFLKDLEDVSVCEGNKRLALALTAHAIPDSEKPFSVILDELQLAYNASFPKVVDFLGITDDNPPDLMLSEPRCWRVGEGTRLINEVKLIAVDDYLVKDIVIQEVDVYDSEGQAVEGKGAFKIEGNIIYVFPRDHNWNITIKATATDSSWNSTTKTLSEQLLWCE